ncbi:hypothetical protein RFI_07123, partial [Reticulomyxa filosa]
MALVDPIDVQMTERTGNSTTNHTTYTHKKTLFFFSSKKKKKKGNEEESDDATVESELLTKCKEMKAAKKESKEENNAKEEEKTKEAGMTMESEEDENEQNNEQDKEKEWNELTKHLPYLNEYLKRTKNGELSSAMKTTADDPLSQDIYLQTIINKFNCFHPKNLQTSVSSPRSSLSIPSLSSQDNLCTLQPWIQGELEKLMPQKSVFGYVKWENRLFRLFEEALVWFEEPNMLSKWWNRKETLMKPLGVLPLAMVTSIETADLSDESNLTLSEEELLTLTLHIGEEGVLVLRCSDVNQRLKWFECLHCAVFNVPKPLFPTQQGLWRIAEQTVSDGQKRWTKHSLQQRVQQTSSDFTICLLANWLALWLFAHRPLQSTNDLLTSNAQNKDSFFKKDAK